MRKQLIALSLAAALTGCKMVATVPQFRADRTPLLEEEILLYVGAPCAGARVTKTLEWSFSEDEVGAHDCWYVLTVDTEFRQSINPAVYCWEDFLRENGL